MRDFFASLYEWFGLVPLYSTDMGDQLRGWDITCTDYIGTPWYVFIGWIMVSLTSFIYAFQYHILDSTKWNKKKHWWIFALGVLLLNFLIAFIIPYNSIKAGDYCNQLNLSITDCMGFGISNALLSFIYFLAISTNPMIRRFSTNCRNTTFWKP